MPVDMKTIAERVGVSKTTVHRALTNVGRISPETREKILKVAAELDYRPNNLARGLRSQKSLSIGFIAVGVATSFSSTMLEGIEGVSSEIGYSLLVARSDGRPSREVHHANIFREKRVDGIIIAPAHPEENTDYYLRLRETGIPFVFVDRNMPHVDSDYVMTDNYKGGYIAGKHLISLGRKHIGFGCVTHNEQMATSVQERVRGLADALKEAGLEPPVMLGIGMPSFKPQEAFAAASVEKYLRDGGRLDGVLGANDNTAIGVITGLKNAGYSVPGDVSVIGFDDLDIAPYVQPALTTVRQPTGKIGEEAVRILIDRVNSGNHAPYKHVLLPPELVIRESCGARSKDSA